MNNFDLQGDVGATGYDGGKGSKGEKGLRVRNRFLARSLLSCFSYFTCGWPSS